jgi:hypothetical protein
MTEHIDGNRLNQDLRYRFEYISKFVNFTHDDIAALNTLAKIVVPLIPVIVDSVYRKLFQYDITKNFFVLRNDGFDGQASEDKTFTLDSAQMTYRRDMLSGYLKRLLLQGVIHKGRPGKGGRGGGQPNLDKSGQGGGGSDAPGRPEAFFECFAYFTFFLKFLKKKILQTGRPRGRGGSANLDKSGQGGGSKN